MFKCTNRDVGSCSDVLGGVWELLYVPVNCIRLRVEKEYTTTTVRLEQCTAIAEGGLARERNAHTATEAATKNA